MVQVLHEAFEYTIISIRARCLDAKNIELVKGSSAKVTLTSKGLVYVHMAIK